MWMIVHSSLSVLRPGLLRSLLLLLEGRAGDCHKTLPRVGDHQLAWLSGGGGQSLLFLDYQGLRLLLLLVIQGDESECGLFKGPEVHVREGGASLGASLLPLVTSEDGSGASTGRGLHRP